MQIVERSHRLLYLYTANVTESRRVIFFLTLVYEELLETSLSLHFSTVFIVHCIDSDKSIRALFKVMIWFMTYKTDFD